MAYRVLRLPRTHPYELMMDGPTTPVRLPKYSTRLPALLDTGADRHFIDVSLAEQMKLEQECCDEEIDGLSGQLDPMPVYRSNLILTDAGDLEIQGPLTGWRSSHGFKVILGRPLLAGARMIYDGRKGEVVLQIDDEFTVESLLSE